MSQWRVQVRGCKALIERPGKFSYDEKIALVLSKADHSEGTSSTITCYCPDTAHAAAAMLNSSVPMQLVLELLK